MSDPSVLGSRPVLGIESSCDEMAAAVLRGREVLANVVHGQADVHAPYGGVVPELASRDHTRWISQVVAAALREAGLEPEALGGVAVTAGPGLVGSLLVGLCFAKAFAARFDLPLVGVHHVAGHLASAEIADAALAPPYLGLVVSGGHTALYRIDAEGAPVLLGETRDDAAGEAFDKVGKLLGLPYPGGPALARLAESGDETAVALPRPMLSGPGLDFSYSGLKTAVALEVERRLAPDGTLSARERADLAASFQAAATDALVAKARRALAQEGLGWLAVVGGVAANQRLRERLVAAGRSDGFRTVFPPLALCTDNAVMIAAAGARRLARGERDDASLGAFARAPVST
ncbi:MAG: tRNA (adenosine(37)-N6)-threonylcarbamoyltransferase complex transferase subunit TsaD [Myxococcota bacterium]|nr:tRNA (adenosine(37)-N6)-threonylcarbamoyltransferase complex transferase subunit TsaD [Myxococcota bacterium]